MSLTPDLVLYLMNQGMRQTDIANEYRVSRQYINSLAKKGGYVSPITTITENFPWDEETMLRLGSSHLYQSLRLFGHYRLEGWEGVTGTSKDKVVTLIKKLTAYHLVLDAGDQYPAIPGVSKTPGIGFAQRTPEDENFVIKIRSGVRITPLGDKIWRLPDQNE